MSDGLDNEAEIWRKLIRDGWKLFKHQINEEVV